MGKFAEAVTESGTLQPPKCRAGQLLDDLLQDEDDVAAYEALAKGYKFSALERLTGAGYKVVRKHVLGSCICNGARGG